MKNSWKKQKKKTKKYQTSRLILGHTTMDYEYTEVELVSHLVELLQKPPTLLVSEAGVTE